MKFFKISVVNPVGNSNNKVGSEGTSVDQGVFDEYSEDAGSEKKSKKRSYSEATAYGKETQVRITLIYNHFTLT